MEDLCYFSNILAIKKCVQILEKDITSKKRYQNYDNYDRIVSR